MALGPTGFTAMLHAPLPEMTWVYGIDREQRTVRYEARDSLGVRVSDADGGRERTRLFDPVTASHLTVTI